ncbi:MAG: hypothetical protein H6825_12955 [Planctomycetes bacterium]|nr:hypothetical protein [Planctomycetota bacterium]
MDVPPHARQTAPWPGALVLLAALLCVPRAARAQCEIARLDAPDARAGLAFGRALAARGSRTLVGCSGRLAYLFDDDTSPPFVLVPPDGGTPGDDFGASVALDGDVAVVGAPLDSGAAPFAGAVHVFERRHGVWTHVVTLRPRGEHVGAEGFGTALALEHDTLLVGRPGDDSGGDDRGAVDVFERTSRGWSQTGKLTEDGGTTPYLGTSVALRGDRAAVGTPGDGFGAAFLFERDVEGYWAQVARLESDLVPAPDVDYGRAVALLGDTAVVSAPRWTWDGARDEGALFVFAVVDDAWTMIDVLRAPDVLPGVPPRGLGRALAARDDVLAAGAPDGPRGQVQLFERSGAAGPFVPTARLSAHDASDARFGAALALLDARLLVGAPDAPGSGAAHVVASSWSRPLVVGLGLASPGTEGAPCLCAHVDSVRVRVTLSFAPRAAGWLVSGARLAWAPFAGGVLVPSPDVLQAVALDDSGRLTFEARTSSVLGAPTLVQAVFVDAGASGGFTLANALAIGTR